MELTITSWSYNFYGKGETKDVDVYSDEAGDEVRVGTILDGLADILGALAEGRKINVKVRP